MPRRDRLYSALLVILPVINPWHLLRLLPFAAIFPSVRAWIASASVLPSYMTGINLNDYGAQAHQQPTWTGSLEFGLILPALFYTLIRRRLRYPAAGMTSDVLPTSHV